MPKKIQKSAQELRQIVLAMIRREETMPELARRADVSENTLDRWRETGDLEIATGPAGIFLAMRECARRFKAGIGRIITIATLRPPSPPTIRFSVAASAAIAGLQADCRIVVE